jgi:hypothetical protein
LMKLLAGYPLAMGGVGKSQASIAVGDFDGNAGG